MVYTLVYDHFVHNGSQWILHNRSVQHDPLRTLVMNEIMQKGYGYNPWKNKLNS